MKDTKSLLLLLVSLLLVLVSFVLIATWGYSFYSKKGVSKSSAAQIAIDSASIANKVSDSLQKIYSATLQNLGVQLDSTLTNSDSLKNVLDTKLAEFYRLRNEIASILARKDANSNYAVARQKIGELQGKLEDLKEKNQTVDNENKKLTSILSEINQKEPAPEKNYRPGSAEKSSNPDQANPVFSAFTASDMRLNAVARTGDGEAETVFAGKAEKLNGAFTVTNFNSQLTNAEMMVVVIKPDGMVLKGSGWESGTFSTPNGRKVYSYKFNFAYTRGDAKRLAFTLRSGTLTPGNYTMELYHNGLMIGKMLKTLS
jgi:regulator of replication initiation timing